MKFAWLVPALAWTLALALLALPLIGLFMGWFASSHWPVRSLRVDGHFEHVSAQTVRDRVKPMLDKGFFAVDPGAVRRVVAALPWVKNVEVRKQWPDQLHIRLIEYQPFARWNDAGLVTRAGTLFRVPHESMHDALPDLRGPAGTTQEVMAFFLHARERFAAAGWQVAGVQLSPRGSWRIRLANGALVTVGKQQPRRRLARFVTGLKALVARQGRAFVSADLRYTNGFAMRWSTPATTGGSPAA